MLFGEFIKQMLYLDNIFSLVNLADHLGDDLKEGILAHVLTIDWGGFFPVYQKDEVESCKESHSKGIYIRFSVVLLNITHINQ